MRCSMDTGQEPGEKTQQYKNAEKKITGSGLSKIRMCYSQELLRKNLMETGKYPISVLRNQPDEIKCNNRLAKADLLHKKINC